MAAETEFSLKTPQTKVAEKILNDSVEALKQLRRERETAQQKLEALVSSKVHEKFYIHSFRIYGAKKTRPSLFEAVLNPALKVSTLGGVIDQTIEATNRLQRLDIFKEVDVMLDTATDPLASPGALDVKLYLEEKSRFWVKTGTEIANNAGSANVSLNIRNIFGGAETLETYMSAGTQFSHVFEFCLAKPINGNPDSKIDISAFSLTKNNQPWSSHEEILRGAALRWRIRSAVGYHEFSLGSTWRQICNIGEQATLSIRESAGHSLKSSITYLFVRDKRDDIMLPGRGYYIKLFQEFAGLGGDVHFMKHELESQVNFSLGKGFILSGSYRNGILLPLKNQKSKISDRFFLGGAQSIRGFKLNGIGPIEDRRDSLGGDAYLAAGLSLFTPLPKLGRYPVKGHLFINGGSLIQLNQRQPLMTNLNRLHYAPSVSTGLGIVYRSSILRLELNFCLPLLATTTDKVKKGLQLGLGFNFW
ncbi:hypothetical protein G9A89_017083 [Geosiphon pyriformis]|nr:hypothetical protein G9A89_017083 [Geosiphon pyriformis]